MVQPETYGVCASHDKRRTHGRGDAGEGSIGAAEGGVSNVDIDGNNALQIKAIEALISTFETLPFTGK
jgi:hypothetical protein